MSMEGIRQRTCKYFHIASVKLPGGSFPLLPALHLKEMNPGTNYGSVFSVERVGGCL